MLSNRLTAPKSVVLFVRTNTSSLHQSLRLLVEAKSYEEIPELLSNASYSQENPFASIIHPVSESHRNQIVDNILQSWISIRPRSRVQNAYSCLLQCTLRDENPFPLSLTVIQQILRAGFSPDLPSRSKLSLAWRDCLEKCGSPETILNEMIAVGRSPDTGTCNFMVSTLCGKDMLKEASQIVKAMPTVGCPPDSDTYGVLITALCDRRRVGDAVALLKEMVEGKGLMPRRSTIGKIAAALKAAKEHRKAVKMIELLEKRGCAMQFHLYESVVKCCAECDDFVTAGKTILKMGNSGFIPYFKLRKMVIDGLVASSNSDLAAIVHQKFIS